MTSRADRDPAYGGQLQRLVNRGFRFVHPTDAEGQLAEIVGVRVHDGVVDVVKLRGEYDVHAMRLPGDEVDVLAPRRARWQSSGHVTQVLAELLDLPDHQDESDGQVRGCWLPVGHGASKWVIAGA